MTAAWHVWVWVVPGCPLPVLQTTGLRRLPAGETRGHGGGMVSPPDQGEARADTILVPHGGHAMNAMGTVMVVVGCVGVLLISSPGEGRGGASQTGQVGLGLLVWPGT